jgi:hypothetical protein
MIINNRAGHIHEVFFVKTYLFLEQRSHSVLLKPLKCGVPYPTQDSRCGNTFAIAAANFNLFIILIAVLENVPPDAGLQNQKINLLLS